MDSGGESGVDEVTELGRRQFASRARRPALHSQTPASASKPNSSSGPQKPNSSQKPMSSQKPVSRSSAIGSGAAEFFASNAKLMKSTVQLNAERLELLRRREDRADEEHQLRLRLEEERLKAAKVDKATQILKDPEIDEVIKDAARRIIEDYFKL